MDEYAKELLKKNLEVSRESLKILKKMNRARIMGGVFRVFKWIVIIAISFGSYYYVEPYLVSLMDTLSSITAGMDEIKKTGEAISPDKLSPDLLEKLKNLLP